MRAFFFTDAIQAEAAQIFHLQKKAEVTAGEQASSRPRITTTMYYPAPQRSPSRCSLNFLFALSVGLSSNMLPRISNSNGLFPSSSSGSKILKTVCSFGQVLTTFFFVTISNENFVSLTTIPVIPTLLAHLLLATSTIAPW